MSKPDQSLPRRHFPLLLILGVCLAVRLILLFELSTTPLYQHLRIDEIEYHELGQLAADGHWFPDALPNHGPGYPWLLGAVFAVFGDGLLAIRLIQILFGLASIALVYLMGRRLFDERATAAGALLLGLYPPLMIFEQRFLAVSFFVLLCLAALALTLRARERMSAAWWGLAGLVFGLSALVRPTSLPAAVLIAGWAALTIREEKKWRGPVLAAVMIAGLLLPVAPVMIENQHRYGEGLMVQMNAGMNLFLGNNPESDGTPYARPDGTWDLIESMPVKEAGLYDARDQDRFYTGKVLEFIQTDPGAFALLQIKKLGLFMNHREVRATIDPDFHRRFFGVTSLPWPGFGIILALALVALPGLDFKKPGLQVLLIFLLVIAVETVITVVASRYRAPFTAALTIVSGYGLIRLYEGARAFPKNRKPLLARAGLLAAGLLIAWLPLGPHYSDAEEYMHLGMAFLQRGDQDQARKYYLEALKVDPKDAMAMLSLCELTYQQGYAADALQWCERAEQADPFNSAPPFQTAKILWDQGNHEQALKELERGVNNRPQYLPGRLQLAIRQAQLGRFTAARANLAVVLKLWPNNPDALDLLRIMDQAESAQGGKP